jgi:hypothetical protein
MSEPTAENQDIHDSLEAQAVRVPALYVVETQFGHAVLPGKEAIAGPKLVWMLTAVDPALGKIVHVPLLFDFEFAVQCGIATEEKARELQGQALARLAEQPTPTEPGGSQ